MRSIVHRRTTLDFLNIIILLVISFSKLSFQVVLDRKLSDTTIYVDEKDDLDSSWTVSGDEYSYIETGAELVDFQIYLPNNFSMSTMAKETGLWVFFPNAHKPHIGKYKLAFTYSNPSGSIAYAGARLNLGNSATLRIITKHGQFTAGNDGTVWSYARTRVAKKLATEVTFSIELNGPEDYAIIDGFEVDIPPKESEKSGGGGMQGRRLQSGRSAVLKEAGEDYDYDGTEPPTVKSKTTVQPTTTTVSQPSLSVINVPELNVVIFSTFSSFVVGNLYTILS